MRLYDNWLFREEDVPEGYRKDMPETGWKIVQIPHDWAISRPVNPEMKTPDEWPEGPASQGFIDRWGIGWYRKHFTLTEKTKGKRYILFFEGVFERCTVYVNEICMGGHNYGYSGFSIDVTDVVHKGENLIAVRVDNSLTITDRWYSGCGIYRKVEFHELPENYLTMEDISVRADYKNGAGSLRIQIRDKGYPVTVSMDGIFEENILAGEKIFEKRNLYVSPWSAGNPKLYQLKITGLGYTKTLMIGFRRIEFIPNQGMFVNGSPVKLKGVCLHHDAGCVGAAVTKTLMRRRLDLLKEMGCNTIRTSHNIASEDLLDLCDEMGFYVIDECFDKWVQGAYARFYEAEWEDDLSYLVFRDRNRPCVVMWSVGNEIDDQGADFMLRLLDRHCAKLRSLDDRPVSLAMSPHYRNLQGESVGTCVPDKISAIRRIAEYVDVIGCNYQEQWYEAIHKAIPDKLIMGTEVYMFFKGSYDYYQDYRTDTPWMEVERRPYVIGGCLWAGIDYLGESMGFPSKGWAGTPLHTNLVRKPISYLMESYWSSKPMVHISILDYTKKPEIVREPWSPLPLSDSWNYPMFAKMPMPYMIFTNCREVRLSLNGNYYQLPRPEECESRIIHGFLPVEKGRVLVEGIEDGKVVCTHELVTSGPSAQLQFTEVPVISKEEKVKLPAQLLFTVAASDKSGNINYRESGEVKFTAEGPCRIEGVDNGYLCSLEPYASDKVHMHQGKASVIVRITGSGRIVLHAASDGIMGKSIVINIPVSDEDEK